MTKKSANFVQENSQFSHHVLFATFSKISSNKWWKIIISTPTRPTPIFSRQSFWTEEHRFHNYETVLKRLQIIVNTTEQQLRYGKTYEAETGGASSASFSTSTHEKNLMTLMSIMADREWGYNIYDWATLNPWNSL